MHTNWRAVTHGSTWRKCLQIGVDDADEEGINAKARREEESPRRGKDGTGLPTDHTDNTDEEGINAKARREKERGIRGRMKSGGIEGEGKI